MIFMGLEKSNNNFISTYKLKTDYQSNLKLRLMYFFTIILPFMPK